MDIQHKLTAFAMVAATWAAWILAGLSAGGVAVALQRAIDLIRTSVRVRNGKTPILIAAQ
jgi:hypothetical protein